MHLGIQPNNIKRIEDIPFLPISFFKTQKIKTGIWQEEKIFESSGTTGQTTSQHYVRDVEGYLYNTQKIFSRFYGDLSDYHVFALLPSYLERDASSLVEMSAYFISQTGSSLSGFYLDDYEKLVRNLTVARKSNRKTILIGVTFALLDLVEIYQPDFEGVVIMETGGMKGRRKELIRKELHTILKDGFNVSTIHSEYGMTELMSQAYAAKDGRFLLPPWMRIVIRDLNDPFDAGLINTNGGINVIDLANVDSCAFVETQDVGRINDDGTFEVLGRFDNSDIRGCNLLVN